GALRDVRETAGRRAPVLAGRSAGAGPSPRPPAARLEDREERSRPAAAESCGIGPTAGGIDAGTLWLHEPACDGVSLATERAAKRRERERQVTEMPDTPAAPEDHWQARRMHRLRSIACRKRIPKRIRCFLGVGS